MKNNKKIKNELENLIGMYGGYNSLKNERTVQKIVAGLCLMFPNLTNAEYKKVQKYLHKYCTRKTKLPTKKDITIFPL